MYINTETDKIVVSNQNVLVHLRNLCRKAGGKEIDELIIADIVSFVNHNTTIDPTIVKRKKKEPAEPESGPHVQAAQAEAGEKPA